MEKQLPSRWQFALKNAAWHLLISLFLAGAAALLVFKVWYPYPYAEFTSGLALYQLVVAVDVVCGPLLTLILASPKKHFRERVVDFTLIGIIQLSALLYGLHSVSLARPVVLAFERDRFNIVTALEVETKQLPEAPAGLQKLSWFGVQRVGVREPIDAKEANESLDFSLKGIEPSMRPNWWLPDDAKERAKVVKAMQPLQVLSANSKISEAEIVKMADVAQEWADKPLYYLPLTSSLNKDWVVLLNKDADFVGFAPIDGFKRQD